MKILVTGAYGFIGKNLCAHLKSTGHVVFEYDRISNEKYLSNALRECEFVFHLAGINRTENVEDFSSGNLGFTDKILRGLEEAGNSCPVLITSSIQAELDNPYGVSKKAAEDRVREYGGKTGAKIFIYRLPNVFGKWSKPNYNSAIATFCYNISRSLPITISNRENVLRLVYIDDVCNEFINLLSLGKQREIRTFTKSLGEIVDTLYAFKDSRNSLHIVNQNDLFSKYLYATYLSYLEISDFSYALKTHKDSRGSFTEIIKTDGFGQFSVNCIRNGIAKGNHYHHTKNEKFLVVSGKARISFRKVGETEITSYLCDANEFKVVDIPCGYVHNITSIDGDSVVFMWASELFTEANLDTFAEEV